MKRLYVVCEGFCEEAFVRTKLQPHLRDREVWAEAIIVTTSRVQRHEVEALVLACLEDLGRMLGSKADLEGLATLSRELGDTPPEDVNDGNETAPSKRLIRHIPGYDKLLYSEYALCEVTMSTLAERCPHFGQWLAKLEAIALAPVV